MVRDVRNSCLGLRLANLYDLSDNKTYILKFSSTNSKALSKDGSNNSHIPSEEIENQKLFVLIESGIRFHGTKFVRDKNELPSPFTMKLRRYIRLKRLEDIKQIGADRVVDMKFGSGDSAFHLIHELYSQGNIILTDHNYEIVCLLRSHQFEEDVAIKVGEIYPVSFTTSMSNLTQETRQLSESQDVNIEDFLSTCKKFLQAEEDFIPSTENTKREKKKMSLKQMLLSKTSAYASYGPEIIEHCMHKAAIPNSVKLAKVVTFPAETLLGLLRELQSAETLLAQLDSPHEGFIIYREVPLREATPPGSLTASNNQTSQLPESRIEFLEFVPLLFSQHENKPYQKFSSFEDAVDHFYGNIDDQKMQKQALAVEEAAKMKIAKVSLTNGVVSYVFFT